MKAMNIPGFTAVDSLYRSRKQYSVTATKLLAAKSVIQPQRSMKCQGVLLSIRQSWNQAALAAGKGDWSAFNHAIAGVNTAMEDWDLYECGL